MVNNTLVISLYTVHSVLILREIIITALCSLPSSYKHVGQGELGDHGGDYGGNGGQGDNDEHHGHGEICQYL